MAGDDYFHYLLLIFHSTIIGNETGIAPSPNSTQVQTKRAHSLMEISRPPTAKIPSFLGCHTCSRHNSLDLFLLSQNSFPLSIPLEI